MADISYIVYVCLSSRIIIYVFIWMTRYIQNSLYCILNTSLCYLSTVLNLSGVVRTTVRKYGCTVTTKGTTEVDSSVLSSILGEDTLPLAYSITTSNPVASASRFFVAIHFYILLLLQQRSSSLIEASQLWSQDYRFRPVWQDWITLTYCQVSFIIICLASYFSTPAPPVI
jgi:hypothetical protein